MDPKLINTHKTTSIYEEQDYHDLVSIVDDLANLIVLPNVWTEVDNLLNNFSGNYKYPYIEAISNTIFKSSEKYIESTKVLQTQEFFNIGLTDALLLIFAKECNLLITSDSRLSDYAIANGISVFDLVKNRNKRLY